MTKLALVGPGDRHIPQMALMADLLEWLKMFSLDLRRERVRRIRFDREVMATRAIDIHFLERSLM